MRKKEKVTLSLDVELMSKIENLAKDQNRSRSNMVNTLLGKAVDAITKKTAMILLAVALLSSCVRMPILDPSQGQIIECNGNIGLVKFPATEGKGHAEAYFYFEDCCVREVGIE
jgi:hypothetical protein